MSAHRFFLTDRMPDDGELLPLSEADVRHAWRVLRIEAGETVEIVEPSEAVWRLRVTKIDAEGIRAEVLERMPVRHRAEVTLFQGVAKGEKMDLIVRQAVEVGATRIVPVMMARTVVQLDEGKRAERAKRWRRIAESAAKQSHREIVPIVDEPLELSQALDLLGEFDLVLVPWEDAREVTLLGALSRPPHGSGARTAVVIGPEGGLEAAEVSALEACDAVAVTLGPWIMRTETAAVVAMAMAVAVALEQESDCDV